MKQPGIVNLWSVTSPNLQEGYTRNTISLILGKHHLRSKKVPKERKRVAQLVWESARTRRRGSPLYDTSTVH